MTRVEEIAGWAAGVQASELPPRVVERCADQLRSVLAAVAASLEDDAAGRVLDGVVAAAAEGPAPLVGRGRGVAVEDAVYGASALSIALDFDDYGCFGHSGHSAALVPLLLAGETGSDGGAQRAAQAVGGEIALRLGGACILGPLNGQMWSFIHAAAAAVAAGRLFELDAARLAHALAIALYQAPRPTAPGFMAPDTKLLTAAEPTLIGLRAARLAAAGVTGPLDILDHRHGFFEAFAFRPLPELLDGLGTSWATETLCIKPYPGCAYIDTTVDALLSLGPLDPDDVEAVEVDAGLLTIGMNAMSKAYATAAPTPVTVNFSIPWNVAIAVTAGRLSPDETRTRWLAGHAAELGRLVERVRLRHDPALTARTLESFAPLLPLGTLRRRGSLLGPLRRMRRAHPGVELGAWGLTRLAGHLGGRVRGLLAARDRPPLDPDAVAAFRMTFPARVRVHLSSGAVLEAEAEVPRGGAGHAEIGPEVASREKLDAWAPRAWGPEGASRIAAAIDAGAGDLSDLLAQHDPAR